MNRDIGFNDIIDDLESLHSLKKDIHLEQY